MKEIFTEGLQNHPILSVALTAAIVTLLLEPTVSFATKIDCFTDPRTDAMTCIDLDNVVEIGGIRNSGIYTGGPNGVRKTNFTIHTNCKTGVTHLKDRDGVSFAGGVGNETALIISLRGGLCGATVKKIKGKS